jgi:hypothetical protein
MKTLFLRRTKKLCKDWKHKFSKTWYFKDDKEVDFHVGGLIPDIGCTRNRNSKFFCTLELYWHMKMMVSLGMLLKEEERLHINNVFFLFGRDDVPKHLKEGRVPRKCNTLNIANNKIHHWMQERQGK